MTRPTFHSSRMVSSRAISQYRYRFSSPVVSGRTISSEPAENVVIFTNTFATYELPSSGGPGSYPFIICGVAILATALLLLEKNRREEGGNKARS